LWQEAGEEVPVLLTAQLPEEMLATLLHLGLPSPVIAAVAAITPLEVVLQVEAMGVLYLLDVALLSRDASQFAIQPVGL
jgi:hypothetical protein